MGSKIPEPVRLNSLLLYKNRPARALHVGDRLEIELEGGETARVRHKDVIVLHPGPLRGLNELHPLDGEIQTAWEILAGELTSLPDLAELVYGDFTPASAWAAWKLVAEGVYFEGSPDEIRVRTVEEVARRQQERDQAEINQRARQAFLQRLRRGEVIPSDRDSLREVENLAFGRGERSPLMRELGRAETPDNAHALLLELGVWDEQVNPYPRRLGAPLTQPDLPVAPLPDEQRRDLSHLPAYAIDDEGTDTPDDALSYERTPTGERLWVHVADASALIEPGSPLDLEARARGESLHLPEGTIHLVPREVTLLAGLGLNEVSPALSIAMDVAPSGEVTGYEITFSRVRVTRLDYAGLEGQMEEEPFHSLERLANLHRARRQANGAVMLDFPEVRLDVEQGEVRLRPLPTLRSRAMVEEAMIMAGIETARFAAANHLRLSFSQQDELDTAERPETLSGMFALRRKLKRSQYKTTPGPHGGLGAAAYTQVTSPLRRYLDLVNHQQLRAFLKGSAPLNEAEMLERIGAAEAVLGEVRQAEFLSEKHWTLVYLIQHPDWRGEGILVEKRGPSGTVLIPDLAIEVRVHLPRDLPLDSPVKLSLNRANLPQREASFRVES